VQGADNSGPVVLTDEEKRAALGAVLKSQTFSRSEQLRSFLAFICEMEMAGRGSELTEYMIGVQALGRREDFSPAEDSSVRTRAHELRQRLQKFYSLERPDVRLRIELSKGSYTPRYAPLEAAGAGPPAGLEHQRVPLGVSIRPWVGGFILGALVAAGALLVLTGRQAGGGLDASVREAWAPLVKKEREVVICVASPLHLLVSPGLVSAQTVRMGVVPREMPRYPAPKEFYSFFSRLRPLPPDATLEMQLVQKAVNVGDVQGLALVVSTLQSLGVRFRILPESNFPLSAMRRSSVILFGAPWFSRAASGLLQGTPWASAVGPEGNEVVSSSQAPQAPAGSSPKRSIRREYREVFGLITVLPSNKDADDGHTIVIFSGLTSVGSHGAAAFFTSGESMRKFRERLNEEGRRSLPRSYQIVVRCRANEDTQLVFHDYETHEVLAK
jgi:hypothetical protein